jgi:hypothetical protein
MDSTAIVISGYLVELSDNIIPFLNKDTDVYVHTWDTNENRKWVTKLNRYKKHCREIYVTVDRPIEGYSKLFSYFTSTYRAVHLIDRDKTYSKVVKFKPNIDGEITYRGNISKYYKKAYDHSRPMLKGTSIDDCIFGCSYYQTLDERIFTATPSALYKMFNYQPDVFEKRMISLADGIRIEYGENPEGSIFWKKWIDEHNLHLIQDIDLKLNNNIQDGQTRNY